ncbi:uncharacterized protein LOC144581682 [Callithrix jacchus]
MGQGDPSKPERELASLERVRTDTCGRPKAPEAQAGPRLSQEALSRRVPGSAGEKKTKRHPLTRILKCRQTGSEGPRDLRKGPPLFSSLSSCSFTSVRTLIPFPRRSDPPSRPAAHVRHFRVTVECVESQAVFRAERPWVDATQMAATVEFSPASFRRFRLGQVTRENSRKCY